MNVKRQSIITRAFQTLCRMTQHSTKIALLVQTCLIFIHLDQSHNCFAKIPLQI